MHAHARLIRQPLIGELTAIGAILGIALAWASTFSGSTYQVDPITFLTATVLVGSLVVAQRFPIQIHEHTTIHMGSVLLYLMAVLLPVPVAGIATFSGMLIAEILVRRDRGLYPSDIATQVGRWTVIVLLGSAIAHLSGFAGAFDTLPLIGAALVLWLGDLLSAPLLLTPVTGKSPQTVIHTLVRESSPVEGCQYVLGILGALAAAQMPWSIALLTLPMIMVYLLGKRSKELRDQTQTLLEDMADTVDLRDPYTGGHSRRVAALTRGLLQELGMQSPDVKLIMAAARVHDIGKIAIPQHILHKHEQLTEEEREVMRQHPELGADLLLCYPDFKRGAEIVRCHHERWDGRGYPYGLRDYDIPFGARVIAVADSYDAMTSDRPYRKGFSPERAAAILREGRGRQWDGAVVDAFLRSIAGQLEQPVTPFLALAPITDDAAPAEAAG